MNIGCSAWAGLSRDVPRSKRVIERAKSGALGVGRERSGHRGQDVGSDRSQSCGGFERKVVTDTFDLAKRHLR